MQVIVESINESENPSVELHAMITLLIASTKGADRDQILSAVNEGMALRARDEASGSVHH
jgi:hypothetical protein